ncbi:pyridoxal phosphate-dependent aminotransferase [Candidatus Poribacteria bacterium]|nr:pyridoxal phosphate-dependent aminotransferase [Candidatus Poribacteria bacterium]
MNNISWWRTSFGESEIGRISRSIRNECISQGPVTKEFEKKLSEFLEIDYVVAVSSGSSALLLALMAIEIGPGDEVILPNRTWIATAHAVNLLGASVVLVDVEAERPIIDADLVERAITNKTKAIIPVHLNGRSAEINKLQSIASRYNLAIIEDAAQAIGSRNQVGYLGTQSDIGCFSLSVAKTISTGQGGFAVTSNNELATRMKSIRTHGVENVKDPEEWLIPGFNFRLTDIQSSIGLEQLKQLPHRIEHLKELYSIYSEGLYDSPFELISVDLEQGEVPVYIEFMVENRQSWIKYLSSVGIESRPFCPDINTAKYLPIQKSIFAHSKKYGAKGIYLPGGPSQPLANARTCISTILKGVDSQTLI